MDLDPGVGVVIPESIANITSVLSHGRPPPGPMPALARPTPPWQRTLTDGTRTVEIYQIADNTHCDGLLMVYLPKDRLLIETDVYTPGPPNSLPPTAVNPLSANLADNITRLGLGVDQLLPLHGRIVPMADLNKAIGR